MKKIRLAKVDRLIEILGEKGVLDEDSLAELHTLPHKPTRLCDAEGCEGEAVFFKVYPDPKTGRTVESVVCFGHAWMHRQRR